MSLYLAYDGSVNANWIARYALRMAANLEGRRLTVVYVEDGSTLMAPELEAGLERIQLEAAGLGVSAGIDICPMHRGVLGGLVQAIPPGPDSFVVCGARVRKGRQGLLRGTISEGLLRTGRYNVAALRVVQPGLLGLPGNVLAPVSGDPAGFIAGLGFLEMMAPDIKALHLLHIVETRRGRLRLQSQAQTKRRRQDALEHIRKIESRLLHRLDIDADKIDSHVGIGESWSGETLVHAARLHAGLIYVEEPARTLAGRLLFDDPLERLLANAPCDVAVYRGARPI